MHCTACGSHMPDHDPNEYPLCDTCCDEVAELMADRVNWAEEMERMNERAH